MNHVIGILCRVLFLAPQRERKGGWVAEKGVTIERGEFVELAPLKQVELRI
jgi:hypothetical protein